LGAALVAALVVAAVPGTAAALTGPDLNVPESKLAAALTCPKTFRAAREPVLLVHGTFLTARESWAWNYGKVLPGLGFDVCTVDLPERAVGDIQVSSEYVVYAVRRIAERSGRQVDVMGHSQGTLEARWAIKWWPDLQDLVDDYVSLAGPHHGIDSADGVCALGSCFPAAHQMRHGSKFLAALNLGDETPGPVSVTSLSSNTDELVQRASTARLNGASNTSIPRPAGSSKCPASTIRWAATSRCTGTAC
jgi:triacylglycerol esterase/lipase EstA (alpha/beta hydrolase family)